jgi:ketosteroid isomerase-like protein
MTTTGESSEVALLRQCFEAMSNGDFAALGQVLAKDAIWRTVDEGPTNCEGRETIIEVMSRNLGGRVRGSIEELDQHGSRVLVAFRPQQPTDTPDRPLDHGIAYMVVTFEKGQIIELKGCADRTAALTYVQMGIAQID